MPIGTDVNFVAIDVETANPKLSSICQVGIASYRNGELADSWVTLVDPEDDFDGMNVSIHGITPPMVRDAPTWRGILPQVASKLSNRIVVSHTAFDRVAVHRACECIGERIDDCAWLDSACVVKRTWDQFSRSGYGLGNVARYLGISYRAHDALEDAKCAGEIMLRAIAATGISIEDWLVRVTLPINHSHGSPWEKPTIHRDGNPEGELHGEVLVFTGSLTILRAEAADLAARAGCCVDERVTKKTTLLVVGDQDLYKLNGKAKSSKHLKAEQLIAEGQPIRIVGQSDFDRIVKSLTTYAKASSA
jgi:DNA polymerase-3 subunit epsilon